MWGNRYWIENGFLIVEYWQDNPDTARFWMAPTDICEMSGWSHDESTAVNVGRPPNMAEIGFRSADEMRARLPALRSAVIHGTDLEPVEIIFE